MNNICGIELKSDNAILTVVDQDQNLVKTGKISLKDSYDSDIIKDFTTKINQFFIDNNVVICCIKKRMEKGKFAGGPITFKIEGLIQYIFEKKVCFCSTPEVNKVQKNISYPDGIKKYMENAFAAAVFCNQNI